MATHVTRLGKDLRDLAKTLPSDRWLDQAKLRARADHLDRDVLALGVKGKLILQLAAYRMAAYEYTRVTGKEYVAVKKG